MRTVSQIVVRLALLTFGLGLLLTLGCESNGEFFDSLGEENDDAEYDADTDSGSDTVSDTETTTAVESDTDSETALEDGIFLEENGLVVIEVESHDLVSPWEEHSDDSNFTAGYTGDAYYLFMGNTHTSGSPDGHMMFQFQISNPGTYRLKIRSNKNPPSGDATHSNDCYVGFPGQEGWKGQATKTYASGASHQWNWNTRAEPGSHEDWDLQFDAGIHAIVIAGRSQHYYIDRFVLYDINSVTQAAAQDLANPESPRTGD